MTDKKFTDEEIIKALEYCNADRNECDKCVFQRECESNPFYSAVAEHALDLINRQKSEIEELNIQLRELWNMASLYKAEGERWEEGYNENLLTANTVLSNEILETKAEAYEEFAEKLKLHSYIISDESQTGIINRYSVVTVNQIDNLLKEMIGEEIL